MLCRDSFDPLSQGRGGLCQTFSAVALGRVVCRGLQRSRIDHRPRPRNNLLALRPLDHVARAAIIRRPLVSGALPEPITETQEDEDRQRQEDDSVNIHVAFAFWFSRRQRVRRQSVPSRNGGVTLWMGQQHLGTKPGLANGASLSCEAMSVETGSCPCHRRIVARFRCEGKPSCWPEI